MTKKQLVYQIEYYPRIKDILLFSLYIAFEHCDSIEGEHLLMAQGYSDGSIGMSLAQNGLELFNLLGHAFPITALTFISGSRSSGDVFLASGSEDGQLSFWDLNSRYKCTIM